MGYTVAYYNEYEEGINLLTNLSDRKVIRLIRKYYEFPEDITTVPELSDYYIDGGSLIELNGETLITVVISDTTMIKID